METRRMKCNVYYSDFAIFPNLSETLIVRSKYYRVEEYNTTHMVVSWPYDTLGKTDATVIANTEWQSPYREAERRTELKRENLAKHTTIAEEIRKQTKSW